MTLDDLKTAWHDLDRKLAATHTAVLRFQAEQKLDRARSALRPLTWKLGWELLEGMAAAALLSVYLAHHFAESRFAVPGLVLFALAVASVVTTVWQWGLLRRIDYAGPVTAVHRQLADLRLVRARFGFWVLVLSPLLWALGLIVVPKGLLGADVYDGGMPYVLANLGFGVAFLLVAWGVARHWAAKAPDSAWRSRLADGFAGRSLMRAKEHVREAERFAADDPASGAM
jgi:hypothetical protein